MIKIKNSEEIEIMRESALVVSRTLGILAKEVKPGVTTLFLDKIAEEYIRSQGCYPRFFRAVRFSKYTMHESKFTSCSWNSQ